MSTSATPSSQLHRRRGDAARRLGVAAGILLFVAGASTFGTRAALAYVALPETGEPGYLTLHSLPHELHFSSMSPGMTGFGQVQVRLEDAPTAVLTARTFAEGTLFDHETGITMLTRVCDTEWSGVPPVTGGVSVAPSTVVPVCPSGEHSISILAESRPISAGAPMEFLGTITADAPRFVLIELAMPTATIAAQDESLMGLSGDFSVQLMAEEGESTVFGDPTPSPTPGTAVRTAASSDPIRLLASTGADIVGTVLCALGAITVGLVARLNSSRRRGARS